MTGAGGGRRAGTATARAVAAVVAGALALIPVSVTGTPVAAAVQRECVQPGERYEPMPWAQRMLAPDRVWPFTRGGDVVVAVLGSGVDAGHPQLAGRVAAGFDALGDGSADDDCLGLGTQVAGVVAAGRSPAVGFAGVAPAATVLPVRVVAERTFGTAAADPAVLAEGIAWAAERADVIAVPVVAYTDEPALRDAVAEAVAGGVTVVAAVGDLGNQSDANPTPYPAAYPDVVGVGAVDAAVNRWSDSQYGDYVDLVAPGVEVVSLQSGGGMAAVDGTGVAAGFVAGAAALVHAAPPAGSSGDRYDVVDRLLATATPAATGPEYGHGLVNPYAAVHDRLVSETAPAELSPVSRSEPVSRPEWIASREFAVAGALAALVVALTVVAVAVAVPRGRRRSWRTAVTRPPRDRVEPEEPGPPLPLFDDR